MPHIEPWLKHRRKHQRCETCGQEITVKNQRILIHKTCESCGILIGKDHEEPVDYDGKCGICSGKKDWVGNKESPSKNLGYRLAIDDYKTARSIFDSNNIVWYD